MSGGVLPLSCYWLNATNAQGFGIEPAWAKADARFSVWGPSFALRAWAAVATSGLMICPASLGGLCG